MISDKKALAAAEIVVAYCNEQRSCQNCIFHLYGASEWKCHLQAFDLADILANIKAKKKHGGYLI